MLTRLLSMGAAPTAKLKLNLKMKNSECNQI